MKLIGNESARHSRRRISKVLSDWVHVEAVGDNGGKASDVRSGAGFDVDGLLYSRLDFLTDQYSLIRLSKNRILHVPPSIDHPRRLSLPNDPGIQPQTITIYIIPIRQHQADRHRQIYSPCSPRPSHLTYQKYFHHVLQPVIYLYSFLSDERLNFQTMR